ncbi:hypothetical protein [Colwellia polaris]|uniref:hypothetical protein n=1 Tax=Colwellia polaris TaxID=326537 RepID=UPI001177A677|nr:hypothetical protein [Colwellia polaris]
MSIVLYFQTKNSVNEATIKVNGNQPLIVKKIQTAPSQDKLKNSNIALTPDDEHSWRDIGNSTVNPFVLEASTLGLASIYPISPLELYQNNIEKAELGDPKSQYLVARAIRECKGLANESKVQELTNENLVGEDVLLVIKAHASYCKDFVEAFPTIELDDWNSHYEWLVKAKENNNHDAMAWYMDLHPDQFSQEQALDILSNAFDSRKSDDFLVYTNALTYISNFVPDSSTVRDSWELAICEVRNMCDESTMKAYITYHNDVLTADEIAEKSKEVVEAMLAKDTVMLKKLLEGAY